MDTYAARADQKHQAERSLPQWKLMANWLMQKIACAWYGYEPVECHAVGDKFLGYFTDIIVQYLVDIDEGQERTPDMARNVLFNCIHDRKEIFYVRHGAYPSFKQPADEAEWIVEAVCLYVKRFDLMSEEMLWIISAARILQSLLNTYNRRPGDGLIPVAPLAYYEGLSRQPLL